MKFPKKLNKDNIAYRASVELEENSYVNLGIGLPSLCAKYIDKKKNIRFQAENGVLGFDELSQSNLQNPDYMDAGGQFLALKPGGRILVADYFIDLERKFNPHGVLMGMTMMATTINGFQISNEQVSLWL